MIRSSPKPAAGHGLSDSTHSTAVVSGVADCIELAAITIQLVSLGRHDVGRGIRDEPFVCE